MGTLRRDDSGFAELGGHRLAGETELAEQFPRYAVTAWMGNSQIVASKHDLQLRDEHFDRASSEVVALPEGDHQSLEGTNVESQGLSQGQKASELIETVKPSKTKNPVKANVLRGSADRFVPLREQLMGAEGLEPPTPSV